MRSKHSKRSELTNEEFEERRTFFSVVELNNDNKTRRQKGRKRSCDEDKLIIMTVLNGEVFTWCEWTE